jgi:hypothetical protein
MHPLRHPRNALAIGVLFFFIVVVYYVFPALFGGPIDWAGFVLLLALGGAMSLMAYVLVAGSPRD